MCSAYIADRVVWSVDSDLFDSDHYPIHIKTNCGKNRCTPSRKPLWKFKEAKWDRYAERLELLLSTIDLPTTTNSQGISDLIFTLNFAIYQAADQNIPKSTGKYKNKEVRWWNDKCEQASKAAKHAFNVFIKASLSSTQNHQIVNLKIEFKRLRAKARLTFKTSKSEAWKYFVTSLNRNAPNKKIWNSIKSIDGSKYSQFTQFLTNDQGETESTAGGMANILADTFAANSSNENFSPEFLRHKKTMEDNFTRTDDCDNETGINAPLTIQELKIAISSSKNSSPGPDGIPAILIKYFSESLLKFLLKLYNLIWKSKVFPVSWKLATIIPIKKLGKDSTKPTSYRPIALTCNLCKILEKIVNRRLRWVWEQNNWLSPAQNGFRQFRSTTDHLVQLESNICNAFSNNLHVIAVAMDIEKAYVMIWKKRIITISEEKGITGRVIDYIGNFLKDKSIQVRVNNTLSQIIKTENGVPQGSVMSVTLFLIAINDILAPLRPPVKGLLFADDLTIFCSGKIRYLQPT